MKSSSISLTPLLVTLSLGLLGCTSADDDGETGASATDSTTGGDTSGNNESGSSSGPADGTGTDDDTGTETDADTGGVTAVNPCEELCGDMAGAPPSGLEFHKSAGADATAHCGTYHMGISDDDSVAIFSMFQDNISFVNDGGDAITVSDLQLIPGGADGQELEWTLLSDKDLALPTLSEDEYVGETITADSPLSFYVELKPAASGAREACLVLSTEQGDDYLVTMTGRGSETPLLNFSTHFQIDEDVRFGALTNLGGEIVSAMSNESHEPGIVDSTNAMYSIGRNVGPAGFAEVTSIVKREADGSWGWMKLIEGLDGAQNVDAKILQVSDETADFGSAHVAAVDGDDNLFVVTNVGTSANSDFTQATVVKFDSDGNVLWSRGWVADPEFPAQANDVANFQAMVLTDGKVILTGFTGGSNAAGNGIPIVGLNAETGDLLFNTVFQIDSGGTQEALSIAVDGDRIYIGGKGARAFVAGLSGLESNSLTLDWSNRIDLGFTGTRIRALTTAEGNVCGLGRGTSTQNMFHMFCLDSDGEALWNRQLGNLPSSRTRSQVIVYRDGALYAGGAIAVSGLSSYGEAPLLKVTTDGELEWSAIYYTGKGAEEIGFHSVKGIEARDGQLYLQGQSWTGPLNSSWYKGFWYDGTDVGLEWTEFADNVDYSYDYGVGALVDNDQGTLIEDTSAYLYFTDIDSVDPSSVDEGEPAYLFQDARDRRDGPGGDYDGFLQVLTEG
ncbi:MAG: hypothetical protein JKY37_31885 [Nannocystaceae bacterium]|nr:hypothetical protein [Nannocystaceae bacterium]